MELSFNCWDEKEWASYINEIIIPIRKSGDILLKFWECLSDNYSSLQISDIKDNKQLLKKLLGGVDVEGEHKNRSAANFYKIFFGWELENVTSYLKNKEESIEIEISTIVNETAFVTFLKKLLENCDKILYSAWEKEIIESPHLQEVDIDFDQRMSSDETIINIIGELYQQILKFTINYNKKTLFLWTMRKNTKRYIYFQYKAICENDIFESLKGLLGFSLYFSPQIDEKSDIAERIIDDYSIWHLNKDDFGYNICQMNNFIFESFKEEISDYSGYKRKNPLWECFKFIVSNPKNFQKEYFNRVDRHLSTWKNPVYINTSEWGGSKKPYWHYEYKIDGIYLPESHCIPSWSRYSPEVEKFDKSLLDLLDDIGPGLFLGKIKPENVIIENEMVRIKE